MSPTARTALIRERFKKLSSSKVVVVPKSEKKPKIQRQPSFGGIVAGWFGNAEAWNWGKTDWVVKPDEKPNPATPSTKRAKGVSPLTVISEKLKRGAVIWEKYPRTTI